MCACSAIRRASRRRIPYNGQYYDWPVGFHVGSDLKDFWTLEEKHLGETTFTHFAEGTAKKNRMQANDFVDSLMYRRGVTCFSCHDVHGTNHNADLIKPPQQLCLTCHSPNSPNGPRAARSRSTHTTSTAARGSQCVECHMPKIEQTIADVNVRSHSFKFITPSMSEQYKIPNPCTIVSHVADDRMGKGSFEELVGYVSVESAVGEEMCTCRSVVAARGHTGVRTDDMHDRL